ncbi:MAG: D-alanyl-D-alanine carboxypeptidase/D-alanyl-D-alanine-endopeptidase [Planctomycetes bacterium]|nr:D-alanyl-D-alanine carboxypeptidase/D-alanyl-D-alanine-endopeptidase [Planctomycetota bacterium]MBI3845033.1 D-alanyl-D-alanine carboxypeptidase/D-alanyl-D-alanine-endopeptidase [Planctomycetota bacterium]
MAVSVGSVALGAPPGNLSARIEAALAAKRLGKARVGVLVVDGDSGRTLFERDADKPFTTASNTKIVTTAAALDLLGPDYTFTTRFFRRGSIENGALSGDLIVVGGGDPNLSGRFHAGRATAIFEEVAQKLIDGGVRKIDGDLVLDDRAFDRQFLAPGWPRDQLDAWYTAPVAALALNDDCLDVTIRPGSAPGQPAVVSLEPSTQWVIFENAATTTNVRSRHKYALSRKPGTHEIRLAGEVWSGAGPATENVTIDDPPLFFGAALHDTLERAGISIGGQVRLVERDETSDAPGGAVDRKDFGGDGVLVHSIGTPLWATVEVTNKHSQNFYAEQTLKTLGYERRGLGSFANGVSAVGEFLTRLGIAPATYTMVDGSGLSAENRFTPRQLVTILRAMLSRPAGAAFFRSLPISGTDGSLEERLKDAAYRGNIVAKTGYIRRVGALSGYARKRSGGTAVFSILLNDFPGSNSEMKEIEDQICRAIVDDAPSQPDSHR